MRRTIVLVSLISVLAGMLLITSSAFGVKAGHNLPTDRLEAAYKIALFERRFSKDGCYPPPRALAKAIQKKTKQQVGVSRNANHLAHLNQVYVLRQGASCGRVRMALRAVGGTYVLDSVQGTIRIQGRKGRATPGLARRLNSLIMATKTFHLTKVDTAPRLETLCPGGRYPVGGGMITKPPTGPDGDGVYPHSYERLGAQLGFHISVVVFDPSPAHRTARDVTVQALCGFGVIPATPTPHRTKYLRPGQTKTVTARCPSGQFLVSGGFQRTDFRSDGGSYVTESRAAGTRAWTVSGHAYGIGSGELTAIAYCARMKNPTLTEVASSPAPIATGQSASTTTPSCPSGRRLVAGGFSLNGSTDAFFAAGTLNQNNTWTASAYGFFGAVPKLTAYGYCWPAR
jgi:hypothetical protein